jgi:hypothetical protein
MIDTFVELYNLSVDFIEADFEGHVFAVAQLVTGMFIRDLPLFSFSSYHGFTEMHNGLMFVTDVFPHYSVD